MSNRLVKAMLPYTNGYIEIKGHRFYTLLRLARSKYPIKRSVVNPGPDQTVYYGFDIGSYWSGCFIIRLDKFYVERRLLREFDSSNQ